MDKQKILAYLREQQHWISQKCSEEWLGIFLFGSQNYHLEDEKSDIDARYIVFSNRGLEQYRYKEREYIEVISFYDFVTGALEGQFTLLETFSTEYFFVNPKYIQEWIQLRAILPMLLEALSEKVSYSLEYLVNLNLHKFRYNETEDPLGLILGYPPKSLSIVKSANIYLDKLKNNQVENFFFLTPSQREELLFYKRGGVLIRKDAEAILKTDEKTFREKLQTLHLKKKDLPNAFFLIINNILIKGESYE